MIYMQLRNLNGIKMTVKNQNTELIQNFDIDTKGEKPHSALGYRTPQEGRDKETSCNNMVEMSGYQLDRNVSIDELMGSENNPGAQIGANTDYECQRTGSINDPYASL